MKKIIKEDYLPDLREIESYFNTFKKEYPDETLRAHGKEDAEHDIPRLNSDQTPPFEQQLQQGATALASKVASRFRSALEILDAKIKALESQIRAEHADELKNIDSVYAIEADASENAFGLTDAHKQLERAELRFEEMYGRYGREPVRYVPHWLYLIFATAIFLGEIPLNALVFQIFGENQVMTWVMAFIIGLAVPLTAHFIGIKMREHGDGFSWANTLKGLAAFGFITIALWGLSIMRKTYLGEFKNELGLTDTLVESSFLFFWLNMAVFVAAIIVAYLAHDSVPGYEQVEYKAKHTRGKVAKAERVRVKQMVSSSKQRAAAIYDANKQFRDRMHEVVMLKGVYDQVLKEGQEQEERVVAVLGKMLTVYRNENLRHRIQKDTPPAFSHTLSIPLKLQELSEKLINNDGGSH